MSNKAASITAAPVSIVERYTSCPGQSQNDMCLYHNHRYTVIRVMLHHSRGCHILDYLISHLGRICNRMGLDMLDICIVWHWHSRDGL